MTLPLILLYLYKRSFANKNYRSYLKERLGYSSAYRDILSGEFKIIWIHAVSVGETKAILCLMRELSSKYPDHRFLITNMTPTGRKIVNDLYPESLVCYLPYDVPHAVKNFYEVFRPECGIIVDTEIWPNLLFYAQQYKIPMYLLNARLSIRSYDGYRKIKVFIQYTVNQFNMIFCQDSNTLEYFIGLGCNQERLKVVGNIKLDNFNITSVMTTQAEHLKTHLSKPVIVFASTRDQEENLILNCIHDAWLYIIVPRHLERFAAVESQLKVRNIKYQKISDKLPIASDTQVLLGDTLGQMEIYYIMSDIAVVGGSFKDFGGQSPIEAVAFSKPVILGPHMTNFKQVAADMVSTGCAVQVNNMQECIISLENLIANQGVYDNMVDRCREYMRAYSGATYRALQFIKVKYE